MNLNEIVKSIEKLPATPQVLPRLLTVLRDPEASADEIVEIIRLDPTLAAQLLKVAGSGYYAVPSGNTDLMRAVSHIGLSETYKIVSGIIGQDIASRPVDAYEIEGSQLWESAIAGAISMEMIARRTHQDPVDAYTTGLFHNLGKLIINDTAGDRYEHVFEMLEREQCCQSDAEREILGYDYAEVGAILLEHWGFNESVFMPVRFQLQPLATETSRESACMLHTSLFLLAGIGMAHGRDAYAFRLVEDALALLYLGQDDVEQMMIDVLNRVSEINQMFSAVKN